MSHLKIGAARGIWPKNDAKEKEKKKKENVGIFSVNSSFFSARKKRNHHENLLFYVIRYGSSRDSSSPYETKNLISIPLSSSPSHLTIFTYGYAFPSSTFRKCGA